MVSRKNATSASERLIPIWRPTALSSSGVGSFALAIGSSLSLKRRARSLLSQTHLLVRRGEVEERVQADGRLLEPRADAVQGRRLEDRRVRDALVHQLLDLVQHGLASLAIALARLLHEQVGDVRIAAVRVRGTPDHECLEAGRRALR